LIIVRNESVRERREWSKVHLQKESMQIAKHTSPAAGVVRNPTTLGKNIALHADTEEPLS